MSARKIVIAHRGASGYLPEHTLEAKALAYGLGADYLEQDVVATRDGSLVVLHDLYLDDVTDVAARFPQRRRADGHFYVIDFDLAEIRQLNVCERREPGTDRARFPARFPLGMQGLRVATLEQEIQLVQGLNRSTGRRVGIYPEIKDPAWHRAHGMDLSRALIATLERFGYRNKDDLAFVQCFDPNELARVRDEIGSGLRLVQLVGPEPEFAPLLTRGGLERIARYADGLGPA
jgi:glycerophosphoryl diester phosphodiesterase